MFDIGISELAVIGLLALILLGPKRLPEVARAAGKWLGRLRRFIASVKEDFDRELQGEELAELRKLQDELKETRQLVERSSTETLEKLQREIESDGRVVSPAQPLSEPAAPTQRKPERTPTATRSTKSSKRIKARRPARERATGKKHGRARRKSR
jgi:sec-independent protein translocase protein TatB